MTHQEFSEQLQRLKEAFGDRAYSSERSALLFKKFQNNSVGHLKEAIDTLILNSRTTPLLTEIDNTLRTQRRARGGDEITPMEFKAGLYKQGTYCDQCGNNGFFLCKKSGEDGLPYAFSCHCDAHSRMGFAFPQFKQVHIKQGFYIDPTFTLTLQGELESMKKA